MCLQLQSNLFITDTKGTGIGVRFREVGFIAELSRAPQARAAEPHS